VTGTLCSETLQTNYTIKLIHRVEIKIRAATAVISPRLYKIKL